MLETVLKGLTLLLLLAALAVGFVWRHVFVKTRDKTGEAYQKAKPGELKLRRWFWILLAGAAGGTILLSCFF